jgi:hypothetical protein
VPLLASVRLFLASSGLTVALLSLIEARRGSTASARNGGALSRLFPPPRGPTVPPRCTNRPRRAAAYHW